MEHKNEVRSVLIILENQPFLADARIKPLAISLSHTGWDVHVLCPAIEDAEKRAGEGSLFPQTSYKNIQFHEYQVKMGKRNNLGFLREYVLSFFHIVWISLKIIKKRNFSVVHLCNPPDYLFVPALIFKLRGSIVIFDYHDLFPEMILIRFKGLLRSLLYGLARTLEYFTFLTADIVIGTNNSYRAVAMERGRFNPDRAFVVRNGPSLQRFKPEEPEPDLKRGFSFMASYAGVMNQEDGVIELIDVIKHIVRDLNRRDIVFYLLGDGGAYNEICQKVNRLQLCDFVKLPGRIKDNRLFRKMLSTSDVLLAPELSNPLNDKSTFIKIAEYMAIGKPIVAFDVKETRYTAGESALYANSGDIEEYAICILRILSDPVRSLEMGKCGQKRVASEFSWEVQEIALRTVYDSAFHLWKAKSRYI